MSIANNMKKTTQGRKKIEIKKIEQVNNRQVTFSKRRAGLFKKASELCILSGAETAIIVCSPGSHVFSFGHQSADAVIDKYVNGSSSSEVPTKSLPSMHEFNKQYEKISKELEAEKKRSVMIEEAKSVGNRGVWWNERVDDLGLEDLEQFVAALEELKKKVDTRADELMMMNASTVPFTSILAMNQTTDHGSDMVSHGFDFGDGQF